MDRKAQNVVQGVQDRRKAAVLKLLARPEVADMMRTRHEKMLKAARERKCQTQPHMIAAE